MPKLRDYQQETAIAVTDSWERHDKVLVHWATGLGKTFVAGYLFKLWRESRLYEHYGKPMRRLFLAYTDEQVDQAVRWIQEWTGEEVAIEKAGKSIKKSGKWGAEIVVSSVQTMMRPERLHFFGPQEFGLVVHDETHHIICENMEFILRHFGGAKWCGLTGTPNREDEVPLSRVFDKVAYSYPLAKAVTDGWLCRPLIQYVKVEELDWFKAYAGNGQLTEERIAEIITEEGEALHSIVSQIVEYSGDRQTIIYAPPGERAAAPHMIANLISSRYKPGAGAEVVTALTDRDQRRGIIDRFRDREFQYLCNVGVFTEGTDVPGVSCIALARRIGSRMLCEQIIGRGLRGGPNCPIPGKADCLILDLLGSVKRDSLSPIVDLLGGNWHAAVRDEAVKMLREKSGEVPADIMAAILDAKSRAAEIRARERRQIIATLKSKATTVDPFAVFADAVSLDEEVCPDWWRDQLPDEEQKGRLKKEGIPHKALSYHEAYQLLRESSRRAKMGLSSYKQARMLRSRGFDPNMAQAEAGDVMTYLATRPARWKFDRSDGVRVAMAKRRGRPFGFDELNIVYNVSSGVEGWTRTNRGPWQDFVTTKQTTSSRIADRFEDSVVFRKGPHELRIPNGKYGVEIKGWKKQPIEPVTKETDR